MFQNSNHKLWSLEARVTYIASEYPHFGSFDTLRRILIDPSIENLLAIELQFLCIPCVICVNMKNENNKFKK